MRLIGIGRGPGLIMAYSLTHEELVKTVGSAGDESGDDEIVLEEILSYSLLNWLG